MVLVPPQSRHADRPQAIKVAFAGTAACRGTKAAFDAMPEEFSWTLSHGHLSVQLQPALSRLGGASLPLPLLDGIRGLRQTLDRAASDGCLRPERVRAVVEKVAQSLPLSPAMAQMILLGPYGEQKYVDIGPPVELQLTYALRRDQPERYDLGYAAITYRLRPTRSDGAGDLQTAATQILDVPSDTRLPPAPVRLTAGIGPRLYRLFFLLRLSPTEHDVALVSAPGRATLEQATNELLARPGACRALTISGAVCTLMPHAVGLEARLRVRVQGQWTSVSISDTVHNLLTEAGVRDIAAVLPTLRVLRPYRSGLAPVEVQGSKSALLNLLLAGGEQVSW